MSRSATPATRNEATTRLKPPKRTTSAKLPIGTAIRGSRGRLRTVANGCGRLRTVATTNATSSEHTLNPQTPRVKREPLLRIREKCNFLWVKFIPRAVSAMAARSSSCSWWRTPRRRWMSRWPRWMFGSGMMAPWLRLRPYINVIVVVGLSMVIV